MNKLKWTFVLIFLEVLLYAQSPITDYLKIAATENPGLRARFKAYQAALEKVDQQGALPDPTLSFGYFISPVETRVGAQRFRLSLSQMFPWMGTTKIREQMASNLAKVKFEEFQEARNSLFLEVHSKWLAIYELEQEIRINEENLEILKTYEPITKTKYEANLVSLADLVRVQIQIDQANTNLDLLRLKRIPLSGDFNTLLNRKLDSPVVVPDTLEVKNTLGLTIDSVLLNQPRVLAAKAQIEAIDSEQRLADLRRKPNLGIGLDYAFVSKRDAPNVDDNGKDILMPMVSVSLPIFGKKNRALQREAGLKKESAEANLTAISNGLRNAWNRAGYSIESAETELKLYSEEIEKTKLLLRVLTGEYSNDSRNFEELLLTQQRLLQLQLAEIKARIKFCQAIFQKDYLTGNLLNQQN